MNLLKCCFPLVGGIYLNWISFHLVETIAEHLHVVVFIRNMRLKSGKNLETIKKHGQTPSLKQGSGKCNEKSHSHNKTLLEFSVLK